MPFNGDAFVGKKYQNTKISSVASPIHLSPRNKLCHITPEGGHLYVSDIFYTVIADSSF